MDREKVIGIPILVVGMVLVWVLAGATVNDGACAFVTTHPPIVRVVEQFLMLCWLV